VGELVNVESFCIDNEINNDVRFYYDRRLESPFVIPEGYSFVVTDIVAYPACSQFDPENPDDL
jgi:hypothetical protein